MSFMDKQVLFYCFLSLSFDFGFAIFIWLDLVHVYVMSVLFNRFFLFLCFFCSDTDHFHFLSFLPI